MLEDLSSVLFQEHLGRKIFINKNDLTEIQLYFYNLLSKEYRTHTYPDEIPNTQFTQYIAKTARASSEPATFFRRPLPKQASQAFNTRKPMDVYAKYAAYPQSGIEQIKTSSGTPAAVSEYGAYSDRKSVV